MLPLLRRPLWPVLVFAACAFFVLPKLWISLYTSTATSFPDRFEEDSESIVPLTNSSVAHPEPRIPNYVHFVYILPDPSSDLSLGFTHYLSIYSAWYYWNPTELYLHTNADKDVLERARSGKSGRWVQSIFDMPGLLVRYASAPEQAGNGVKLQGMEHKSDFVRTVVVEEMGGIYIDWDVYALRDIAPLRDSGYRAVGGLELGGQLNSGTFLSEAHGKMITMWIRGMNEDYDGAWTTHSNRVLTRVGNRLLQQPYEMLILEREVFASGSWKEKDTRELFDTQKDIESNLKGVSQGDSLPIHTEELEYKELNENVSGKPFPKDWSRTYLLHAFNIEKAENITPRYVLERRSNFARAVYPVARDMYEKGHIMIGD